jgi:hypothetical protein
MEALDRNKTWSVVERPENQKLIDCRWVFKINHKSDGSLGRYKARLVAKGFTQRPGVDYDETFAPVVRFDSLCLLHTLAAHNGWTPQQLNIKSAFIYRCLSETIYMRLPGRRENNKVAKLHKYLYGLKQSPREWYSRLSDFLQIQGYIPTHFGPCVFVLTTGQQFLAVYVDNISIYGPADSTMDYIKRALKSEFEVTDLGDVHWPLCIQIEHTPAAILLSQTSYIDTVLTRFQMDKCRPTNLPIDPNARVSKYEGISDPDRTKLYQQIIGSLMYCVTGTRPDLAYVVTFLSRFS